MKGEGSGRKAMQQKITNVTLRVAATIETEFARMRISGKNALR